MNPNVVVREMGLRDRFLLDRHVTVQAIRLRIDWADDMPVGRTRLPQLRGRTRDGGVARKALRLVIGR